MRIELIKPWGMSAAGEMLKNVNKPVADLLIQRNIAKLVVVKKKKAKKKVKK